MTRGTQILFCLLCLPTAALAESRVMYLANQGVLIEQAESKVLFDPLFDNAYGQYELVPDAIANDLLQGNPPFDSVDAVFVSHAHGDHFAADLMLGYLRAQEDVRLYAPVQAVSLLRERAGADANALTRVIGIALDRGDEPARFEMAGLDIRAVRIPHSGWPTRRTDIENLAFHVRLDSEKSVMHFGDSDAAPAHFAPYQALWSERATDLALPPYWFFLSNGGRQVLDEQIQPKLAIGTHVPTAMPDDPALREAEFDGVELFTEPGQSQPIP